MAHLLLGRGDGVKVPTDDLVMHEVSARHDEGQAKAGLQGRVTDLRLVRIPVG
ncbi:MAG: hypothetical protein R2720_00340 [Candidatus Nanopelagicales bacterium]